MTLTKEMFIAIHWNPPEDEKILASLEPLLDPEDAPEEELEPEDDPYTEIERENTEAVLQRSNDTPYWPSQQEIDR